MKHKVTRREFMSAKKMAMGKYFPNRIHVVIIELNKIIDNIVETVSVHRSTEAEDERENKSFRTQKMQLPSFRW